MKTTPPCFLSFGLPTLVVEMRWHRCVTPVTPQALSWLRTMPHKAAAKLLAAYAGQVLSCNTAQGLLPSWCTGATLQKRSWPWRAASRWSSCWVGHLAVQVGASPHPVRQRENTRTQQWLHGLLIPCQMLCDKEMKSILAKMQQLGLLTPKRIHPPHVDCIQTSTGSLL